MKFIALQKSIWVLEKSWKSPGNLFLKKGMNPVHSLFHDLPRMIRSAFIDITLNLFVGSHTLI